jgi:hypothetical protein
MAAPFYSSVLSILRLRRQDRRIIVEYDERKMIRPVEMYV